MTGSLNTFNEKELRRLKHSNHVEQVIKIEDDCTDYSPKKIVKQEETPGSSVNNKGCGCETSDVAVQTESFDIVENLKKLINLRMSQYEAKVVKEELFGKGLASVLQRLQKENKELQSQVHSLRLKINENEKIEKLKRPAEVSTELYGKKPSMEQKNLNQAQVFPETTLYCSPVNRQPRPPVQLVAPVRQMPPSMHFQQMRPNDPMNHIIIVDRGNFPPNLSSPVLRTNFQGINTQVVAVNQGPRMTSLTPDNRAHRLTNNIQTGRNPVPVNFEGTHFQVLQPWPQQQQPICPAPRYQPPYLVRQLPPPLLPKLKANITATGNCIVLTWDYDSDVCDENYDKYKVESYNLYAQQSKETNNLSPKPMSEWKKIGVVSALPLPMACTLSQISKGYQYFFAVVAVDAHEREGPISNHCYIKLI